MGKFINPFTDYGFKMLFGRDFSKDILKAFLNDLLKGEREIDDIVYTDKEVLPHVKSERGIIYDIYCKTTTGEHIIVEMQNRMQEYFVDRALFYLAGDIHTQGQKGDSWNYKLIPVYGIYFMNWEFDRAERPERLRIDVGLTDLATGELFSDKMRMIFIQVPLMTKSEEDCETDFERWIYVLKNMETLSRMPFAAQKEIFSRLGSLAEIEAMPEPERSQYEESLRVYRDNLTVMRCERQAGLKEGREEGRAEGREEGRAEGRAEGLEIGLEKGREVMAMEVARNLKSLNLDIATICKATGLTPAEIEKL